MFKIVLHVIFAVLLFSCSTPYQRRGVFEGGYSETQLGKNTFRVRFSGNGLTSRERSFDYSMLRSAELTLKHGFRYFVVTDSDYYSKTSTYTTKTTSYGAQTYSFSKPRTISTIVCFEEKPDIKSPIFDAKLIYNSITSKYKISHELQYLRQKERI